MSNGDALFSQLDAVFTAILSGMSPAGRQRTARSVGTMLRRSQSQRIGRQEAPDGSKYPQRKQRILRAQAGMRFIWQGETRQLRNWRATRGRHGRMLTGFDIDRGDMRSFYREDIERYLDINFNETRRNTTKSDPMFRRLRTARFLKANATPEGAEVGFSGVAARIARVHQFGLRDKVNRKTGLSASYPARQLLGFSAADEAGISQLITDHLARAR